MSTTKDTIKSILLIVLVIQSCVCLSIRKNPKRFNTIPQDESDLWFGDELAPPKTDLFQSSSSPSSSPDKSSDDKPVITLKNNSEGIPFTRVDASLQIDGFTESDKPVEEGVGPAASFDYDTGFTGDSDDLSGGPENNYFENGDLKIEISNLKPVYVKPPSGFKPILYPNREMDGIARPTLDSSASSSSSSILPPPKEPYPYPYPFGLSSWSLGGIRGIERGGFWESLGSDTALNLPVKPFRGNPVSVVEWIDLAPKQVTSITTSYKPPLPPPAGLAGVSSSSTLGSRSSVPLGSWIFGGLKEMSPFWQMPPMVVEKIEFVPFQANQQSTQYSPSYSLSSSSSSSSPSSSSTDSRASVNSYWIISENEPGSSE